MTARRLNRNEYSNTIRDLLAVDFRAERDSPTDDLGHGFDNMSDVLTIYLSGAHGTLHRRGGEDCVQSHRRRPVAQETCRGRVSHQTQHHSTCACKHDRSNAPPGLGRRLYCADWTSRGAQPGRETANLGFLDEYGNLLQGSLVETEPSKLEYFDPYSDAELRWALPAGDHFLRAGFINDDFVKRVSEKNFYSNKKNKYLNSITFVGPFPARVEKPNRKKILTCDPIAGPACGEKILSTLARRA